MSTKLKIFTGNYDKYEGDVDATSDESMQEYHENQNDALKEVIDGGSLWQSNTAYAINHIIYLKNGLRAKCITAGTSGGTEPTWSVGNITDGSITWQVSNDLHYNGSELWKNLGSSGTIKMEDGRCFQTSSTMITLPSAPSGSDNFATTITIFCTATSSITWGGNIKWASGTPPDATGDLLVTFYGANGIWRGLLNGSDFA